MAFLIFVFHIYLWYLQVTLVLDIIQDILDNTNL